MMRLRNRMNRLIRLARFLNKNKEEIADENLTSLKKGDEVYVRVLGCYTKATVQRIIQNGVDISQSNMTPNETPSGGGNDSGGSDSGGSDSGN